MPSPPSLFSGVALPHKRYTVRFEPDDVSIDVYREAENLLRVAMVAGVHVNASCGGAGTCGKCKVKILEGEFRTKPSAKLSAAEKEQGYCLACQTEILGDLVVEVPVESRYEKGVLSRGMTKVAPEHVLAAAGLDADFVDLRSDPAIVKYFAELRAPSEDDNVSDMGRLGQYLKQEYGVEKVTTDFEVMRTLAAVLREGDWKVTATVVDDIRTGRRLTHVEPGDTRDATFCLAIDVGTTTINGSLLDVNSGQEVATAGDYNAQVSMGEDVISRIVNALKPGGQEALQKRVVKTINGVIAELLDKAEVDPETVSHAVFAGNTTRPITNSDILHRTGLRCLTTKSASASIPATERLRASFTLIGNSSISAGNRAMQ